MKIFKYIFVVLIIFYNSPVIPQQSQEWYNIYFTKPEKNDRTIEQEFVKLIDSAKISIYGAFYQISLENITKALHRALNRGVDIKLVLEKDNLYNSNLQDLYKAGVVVLDSSKGLMHNKFAIIDNEILWTGSFNLTENSLCDNNNVFVLRSPEVCKTYKHEFDEMFKDNIFGNKKESTTLSDFVIQNSFKIYKTNVFVYFSPEDNIRNIIIDYLNKSKKSIHFMSFSMTDEDIGETIIKRFKQGIKVFGIFEKNGSDSSYSEYVKMKLENIPVKLDKNKALMHHKVIIIDNEIVITGSYNFSRNANKQNDENVLILHEKNVANKFLNEFYELCY